MPFINKNGSQEPLGPQGPQGPQGPRGYSLMGPQGPQGPSGGGSGGGFFTTAGNISANYIVSYDKDFSNNYLNLINNNTTLSTLTNENKLAVILTNNTNIGISLKIDTSTY